MRVASVTDAGCAVEIRWGREVRKASEPHGAPTEHPAGQGPEWGHTIRLRGVRISAPVQLEEG